MNSKKLLNKEHKESLQEYRNTLNTLFQQNGELGYQLQVLQAQMNEISIQIQQVLSERDNLLVELEKEYGKGSIDVDKGIFFPEEV